MPFPTENDNDDSGEVISLDGAATGSTTDDGGDTTGTALDRGDDFTPTDDEAGDKGNEGGTEEGRDAPAPRIPKARFDEVNEGRKAALSALDAANAEIERLRTQSKPAAPALPEFDEDAKEAQYIEAMMEGNTEAALAIRREINANIRASTKQELIADNEYNAIANSLEAESTQAVADYPYLETEEGEYALGLIVAARDVDIAKGVPMHLALRRAVAAIAPRFMPDDAVPPTRDSTRGNAALDTRTQDALRRGAQDSSLQPPSLQAGIGTRITGARVNVEALDEDQFRSLSAADKKRLRGD